VSDPFGACALDGCTREAVGTFCKAHNEVLLRRRPALMRSISSSILRGERQRYRELVAEAQEAIYMADDSSGRWNGPPGGSPGQNGPAAA